MSKKKEITLSIIGVLTLVVIVIGSSYAYYVARTNSGGEGSSVDVRTATLGNTTVTTEGSIGFSDTNIYPGHKNISKIKVTATGDKNVLYNLTWTGTNTLNTPLKYYVYKTTTNESPTITCTKKEEGTIETILYEECVNNNFDNLGEVVKEGTIETSGFSSITKLIKNEEIQATSSGATTYYYIILEYPNIEDTQNIDMNGTFNGVVNTTLLEKKDTCDMTCQTILINKTIEERTDFSTVLTDNTSGKIYTAEDNDGTSYYFAGAVDNNWVKFGGFYWRIIRINGDGTLRLIYNGPTTDQTGETTQIGTAKYSHKDADFNSITNEVYVKDNAYVGYMYGTPGSDTYETTHTNTNSSYVKQVVDEWYNTNLNKTGIKEYIDANAGFCGDRSIDIVSGYGNGLGYSTNQTAYNGRYRLYTNKTPRLKCTNSNDLYTVSGVNKGNEALTYPVGLISADEVAYAGGVLVSNNQSYYLYTNQVYWTMSPLAFTSDFAVVFDVGSNGNLFSDFVDSAIGVRPVINLKADTKFTGDGTVDHPYEIA